ncbi:CPBP family intramembrane glutamic endopeptidase [Nonomuraea sp. CA-218870]|uniref:CPBP family intramembrane glutamic endopeptidase n=1 Tax=Nonomuraea sp. CA-218870 TaxID=3239998 RepID=UPI003D93CB66
MQENPEPSPGPYGPPAYAPYPPPPSWFAPVPQDARYDQLARTPANRLWRQVVGTLVVAAGFFVIGTVVLLAGTVIGAILRIPPPGPGQISGDPVYGMLLLLLSIAAVLPLVFGVAALVQRRRPGTLSSVAGRLRWSWLLICGGVALLSMVLAQIVQMILLVATGQQTGDIFGWTGWERFLPALVVIVLFVPFQAATEEYMFRGWLLQAFGAHLRNPWWGIVISSVLFASLHGYSWAGLLDVFSFGVAMAFLAVRTGGLEAAIALHVLNNMMAFGVSAAAGKLDEALDQASVPVPWQALAATVVQLGVFIILVLYLAKKRSISTTTG